MITKPYDLLYIHKMVAEFKFFNSSPVYNPPPPEPLTSFLGRRVDGGDPGGYAGSDPSLVAFDSELRPPLRSTKQGGPFGVLLGQDTEIEGPF